MMGLQFERFRETASLNRYRDTGEELGSGREETGYWVRQLVDPDEAMRISAAQRSTRRALLEACE